MKIRACRGPIEKKREEKGGKRGEEEGERKGEGDGKGASRRREGSEEEEKEKKAPNAPCLNSTWRQSIQHKAPGEEKARGTGTTNDNQAKQRMTATARHERGRKGRKERKRGKQEGGRKEGEEEKEGQGDRMELPLKDTFS